MGHKFKNLSYNKQTFKILPIHFKRLQEFHVSKGYFKYIRRRFTVIFSLILISVIAMIRLIIKYEVDAVELLSGISVEIFGVLITLIIVDSMFFRYREDFEQDKKKLTRLERRSSMKYMLRRKRKMYYR